MADSPPPSPLRGHSVSSLNTQLLAHGFAKRPLRLDALPDAEQVNVTGVLVELLGANVNNLDRLEELSARHRSLQFEWERVSEKVERQAKAIAKLEHNVELGKARAAEAERKASAEEREAQKLRHEIERGKRNIETLRTAAQQEAKRQQIKLDKLTAAPRHQLPHFTLLNPIAPGTMAPAAPGPLPLLEAGIRDLDALRQSAKEEAEAFRHVIVGLANGLNEALAWSEGRDVERILLAEFFETDTRRGQAASWTAHPSIADIKLKRLLEDVRERLMEGPAPSASAVEEEDPEAAARERERQRQEADLRDRVKDLEVEVGIARAKEMEAQKVVEEMARNNAAASVPSTTDFADQKLRDELVRQKRLLDAEREELTRAQVAISEERLSFEEARRVFEERRSEEIERALMDREREREGDEESKRKAEDSEEEAEVLHEHRPSRPSPLSPHRKRHVKKRPRPSLQRIVVEKQHHAKAAASTVTPAVPAPPGLLPALPISSRCTFGKFTASASASTSASTSTSASASTSTSASASTSVSSSAPQQENRTPPAAPAPTAADSRVLTEGGEKANASNTSGETPMLGGARLLKAGVTLRKTSDRPRKKAATKPPVAAGLKAVRRTPETRSTLEAAGIRKSTRSSTGSSTSAGSASSDGRPGVTPGMTPSQRRLLSGTAASNAKAKRVESDKTRPGAVWK